MVLARVVAGEVSGRDIRDCVGVDAYNLCGISLQDFEKAMGSRTFRRRASSGDIGAGAMVVANLRFSHNDSTELQKSLSALEAADSRQRRKSSASSSSIMSQAVNFFNSTRTVS